MGCGKYLYAYYFVKILKFRHVKCMETKKQHIFYNRRLQHAPLVQRLGYEPSKLETRVRLPDGAFSDVAHCTLVPWIFLFLAKTIDSTAAPGTSQSQQVARTHKCCIWRSVNNFVYNAVHIAPSFIALSPVSQCRDLLFFVFYCAR